MSILKKIKNINIIKYDLLAFIIFFALNFILYLNNLKLRLWLFLLVSFLILIFFIIGNLKLILNKETKSYILITSIISMILLCVILVYYIIFFFFFSNNFVLRKEYYKTFDDKPYIVFLKDNNESIIEFYEYKNPFIMGNAVKLIANYQNEKVHFNKEPYDDSFYVKYYYYDSNNILMKVEEILYNENGIIINREKLYPKEKDNHFSSNNNSLNDNDEKYSEDNKNDEDKILTLADCEVLYEKQFGDKILRYSVLDYALGQRLLVRVIASEDNGKTFNIVTEKDYLSLNSASQITFIDEQLGFVVPNTSMDSSKNIDIYVTQDGGKTFTSGTLLYDTNVYYIGIYDVPYLENGYLKLKCLVYKHNKSDQVDWIFTTNNNGLTWTFEKEQPVEE